MGHCLRRGFGRAVGRIPSDAGHARLSLSLTQCGMAVRASAPVFEKNTAAARRTEKKPLCPIGRRDPLCTGRHIRPCVRRCHVTIGLCDQRWHFPRHGTYRNADRLFALLSDRRTAGAVRLADLGISSARAGTVCADLAPSPAAIDGEIVAEDNWRMEQTPDAGAARAACGAISCGNVNAADPAGRMRLLV